MADVWKQRVTLYNAKFTDWSTKASDQEKYRQKKNESFVSFAEGQAWVYNHCESSDESSDKATIHQSAAFLVELQKEDSTFSLDDLRITAAPCGTICYCDIMQVYKNVGHTMRSSSRQSGIVLSTPDVSL